VIRSAFVRGYGATGEVLNRWHLRNLFNLRLGSLILPLAIAARRRC
jgi:hypothetical protein